MVSDERGALVDAGAVLGAALGRERRDTDRDCDGDENGHALIIGLRAASL
jgi:hypothetical protein